jgi:hypothetical protein
VDLPYLGAGDTVAKDPSQGNQVSPQKNPWNSPVTRGGAEWRRGRGRKVKCILVTLKGQQFLLTWSPAMAAKQPQRKLSSKVGLA